MIRLFYNEIAPKLLLITDLYRGKTTKDSKRLPHLVSSNILRDLDTPLPQETSVNLPLVIRKTY